MLRTALFSLVVLSLGAGSALAEDKSDKKAKEAKIVKVDAKKGTVTVKMQVNGKEVEKTFKLAENIEYADSTGRVAAADVFTSGDMVLIVEEEGKISKMKKTDKTAGSTKPNGK